jgi:hypothetical protein
MSDKYAVVGYVESRSPPENGLKLGKQGKEDMWLAVAKTKWGTIPGKANKDGTCWYPFYSTEYRVSSEFAYVTSIRPTKLVKSDSPPPIAIISGYQTDRAAYIYAAVADTDWGTIPGKAQGDTCWYPYNGKEHKTKNFSWVVLDQ